jgi:hypothetical protein
LVRPVGFSGIEGTGGLRGMGLKSTDPPDAGQEECTGTKPAGPGELLQRLGII